MTTAGSRYSGRVAERTSLPFADDEAAFRADEIASSVVLDQIGVRVGLASQFAKELSIGRHMIRWWLPEIQLRGKFIIDYPTSFRAQDQ